MRALRAVRLSKAVVEAGRWRQDKMPRLDFPLSKSKGYCLGIGWHWGVWRLTGDSSFFKLLVAFHPGKEEYRAWLALEDGTDSALLARLQHHATLHGWHLHCRRNNLADVARGMVKESEAHERRRDCRDQSAFTITRMDALSLAFRMFKVTDSPAPEGLLT
jgi:hypothetical protein